MAEQVGQLFMVGVPSSGLTGKTAGTLESSRVGSVILLGNTQAGVAGVKRLTQRVRTAARPPAGVGTLLAADQEGGLVQRLQGAGFARVPAASTQARLSDSELRRRAGIWGSQLRSAGVDADLAPVADVVPAPMTDVNQPIGVLGRGFGADPAVVARKVVAVVSGMDAAGVATAVKHFPGLGRVRGNTDLVSRVVDTQTTRRDQGLLGFQAAVAAGVDMVMVASAVYARIDPTRRAAYSQTIIEGMIREDLRFGGVVISDDLAAPGIRDSTPGERAVRFLQAGGDLVIVGDARVLAAMISSAREKARDDPAFASGVEKKAARVIAMKNRRGLADC